MIKKEDLENWDSLGKLKKIDFGSGKFEANGKTYYLETKLTSSRYCEYQILQRELAMGMTIKEIYDGFSDMRKLLNQTRFVDSAVFVDKILTHCLKLKEKEPIMLKICTLFVNTEDEDRTTWDNDLTVKKLEDWKREGIDVECFFRIALTLVSGFTKIFNDFTQSTLEAMGVAADIVNASSKVN
jgi:hypothetical protein